jgi:flavin reductase (DIM6/NTAB) family NADH-FMN oxidoreductase RutF
MRDLTVPRGDDGYRRHRTVSLNRSIMTAADTTELFKRLDREVWILTAADGPRHGGLVATAVMQGSIALEAPRVVVGISRLHATWGIIEASRAFALHLVSADRIDLVERFGLHSRRDLDKFAGLAVDRSPGRSPRLVDAAGWIDCRVEAAWDSGDRTFYLAEALAACPPVPEAPLMTTAVLRRSASRELLTELRRQLDADAAQDLEAIRRWREARGTRS